MRRNRTELRRRLIRKRREQQAAVVRKHTEHTEKGSTSMDIRFAVAAADFAVNLLKGSFETSENILLSPVSVEAALLMAACGAGGNTKEEFRKLFGGEMSMEELEQQASAYIRNLPTSEKARFHLADSVWIEKSLPVKQAFIDKNRSLYQAEVCQIPFNQDAVTAMNTWVEKNTAGMIDRIIEEVDPANLLYLINALSFDGEWQKIYDADKVKNAVFTGNDGSTSDMTGMYSTEELYITNEECDGFVKPYADGKYSFVGLVPKNGQSLQDFVGKLSGAKLLVYPASAAREEVDALIPKFSVSDSRMLSSLLISLGLPTAMSYSADFSGISDTPVGIDEVIHKTTLTMDERGTKAGAVTAVMMKLTSLPLARPKVYLDRPFVYEIIDNSTLIPLFIGVMNRP